MKYFEIPDKGEQKVEPRESCLILSDKFNTNDIVESKLVAYLGDESNLYQIRYSNNSYRYLTVYLEEITGYGDYNVCIKVSDRVFDSPVKLDKNYDDLDNWGDLEVLGFKISQDTIESTNEDYNFIWCTDWLKAVGINEAILKGLFKIHDYDSICSI